MQMPMQGTDPELTALLIAPDRELARGLMQALGEAREFQVLAELKAYPPQTTLEMRVRQLQPDVILLDLASDFEAALALIGVTRGLQPPAHVIGFHRETDPKVLLGSLRAGAADFLAAPFAAAPQHEAAARIRRLREPDQPASAERGKLIMFSSTKPGSGATTLATQFAFSLKRLTGKRVLLADFDLYGGSVAFSLKLNPSYSVLDALERADRMDPALWATLTAGLGGVDVLAAPDAPVAAPVDPDRLHALLDYARLLYDWVVVDVPSITHRLSLSVLPETDRCFLVTTTELPSLHLSRRAVGLLAQLGFGRDRFQMLVNRAGKKEDISAADMEKVFGCPVFASLPNDFHAVHRAVTRGEPLAPECELGRALQASTAKACGLSADRRKPGAERVLEQKPALSQG